MLYKYELYQSNNPYYRRKWIRGLDTFALQISAVLLGPDRFLIQVMILVCLSYLFAVHEIWLNSCVFYLFYTTEDVE